jgi:hypothetical protein
MFEKDEEEKIPSSSVYKFYKKLKRTLRINFVIAQSYSKIMKVIPLDY